jgi:hypothetical protein
MLNTTKNIFFLLSASRNIRWERRRPCVNSFACKSPQNSKWLSLFIFFCNRPPLGVPVFVVSYTKVVVYYYKCRHVLNNFFLSLLASVCNLYKQCIVEQWFCDGYIHSIQIYIAFVQKGCYSCSTTTQRKCIAKTRNWTHRLSARSSKPFLVRHANSYVRWFCLFDLNETLMSHAWIILIKDKKSTNGLARSLCHHNYSWHTCMSHPTSKPWHVNLYLLYYSVWFF